MKPVADIAGVSFLLPMLAACLLIPACNYSSTQLDEREIYATALSELAPAITHFAIAAEKIDLVTDEFAPDMAEINEHGSFNFHDTKRPFTADDFPGLTVTLLASRDIGEVDSGGCEAFWKGFREKHKQSSGFLRLSGIGFSESGTEAIFYVVGQGGCLIGKGTLVLMRRESGSWVVALEQVLWVA